MKQNVLLKFFKYSGLALSILYLFFYTDRINIELIYYWQQTIGLTFGKYLSYPGGASDFLAVKLLELYTYPIGGIFGAAVLVLAVYWIVLNRMVMTYAAAGNESTALKYNKVFIKITTSQGLERFNLHFDRRGQAPKRATNSIIY